MFIFFKSYLLGNKTMSVICSVIFQPKVKSREGWNKLDKMSCCSKSLSLASWKSSRDLLHNKGHIVNTTVLFKMVKMVSFNAFYRNFLKDWQNDNYYCWVMSIQKLFKKNFLNEDQKGKRNINNIFYLIRAVLV